MRRPDDRTNPPRGGRRHPHALALLDWLAPLACLGCGRQPVAAALCAECLGALPWWRRTDGCPRCGHRPRGASRSLDAVGGATGPACGRCVAQHAPLDGVVAAFRYADPWPGWLPRAKHGRPLVAPDAGTRRLLEFGGEALAEALVSADPVELDCLLPVPLHRGRAAWRGFNQSARLARACAQRLGCELFESGLSRIRATRTQAGLDAAARRRNLRGAFRADPNALRGARVGVVDDVITTGATLDAAAEALLAAGAQRVVGLALTATTAGSRGP